MKKMVAILILLAAPALASAQTQGAGSSAEMRKLDFLLGAWEGEGRMDVGPGQHRAAKVKESVQSKAEGSVLTFEGLGKAKLPGKDEETVVHNAFAVIWYDSEARRFRMLSWRAGQAIDANITVGEKSLIWSFRDQRAGQIRFTIKLDDAGQWFETGEISGDGTSWNKFFEMRLNRSDGK
jgi:hypothetical protein